MLLWVTAWCLVADAGAAPVRVNTLASIAVYPERTAPATVVSNSEAEISAEVAARVVAFDPRVGDIVAAGAVIASLDCRDYTIALRAARAALDVVAARLELAERRLVRARELRERNSIAVEVLDEREAERAVLVAEVRSAQARIAADEVAVSRCAIRAPYRALLRSRLAPVGRYVAVGDPVARVIDVDDLELSAQIGVDDVAAIERSAALEFVAGDERYPVVVRQAVAAVNTETRNREVRLRFTDQRPLSGRAGQLVWRDSRAHLPGKYLVRREEALGFFVVEQGRARFVAAPRAQAGRASPVAIDTASVVVVDGHYALSDGEAVELLDQP